MGWATLLILLAVTGARAQSGSTPEIADPQAFLETAKVIRQRPAGGGITGSARATLSKGGVEHDAHFQTVDIQRARYETEKGTEVNFRDCYRYNIAAYRLARMLGLENVPLSIERSINGEHGALTWWIDGVVMTEGGRLKKNLPPPDPASWSRQMANIRVFDQLIDNVDRNLGNLVIDGNWKIWMIDHTRSFRVLRTIRNASALHRCDYALYTKLKELQRDEAWSQMNPWITKFEFEGLMARRDRIVAIYEEKLARDGMAATFYGGPAETMTASKQ